VVHASVYLKATARSLLTVYYNIKPLLQLFDANLSNPFLHRNLEGQHSNSMVAPRILQTFEMHNTSIFALKHQPMGSQEN
jgi:hypothetical protein